MKDNELSQLEEARVLVQTISFIPGGVHRTLKESDLGKRAVKEIKKLRAIIKKMRPQKQVSA